MAYSNYSIQQQLVASSSSSHQRKMNAYTRNTCIASSVMFVATLMCLMGVFVTPTRADALTSTRQHDARTSDGSDGDGDLERRAVITPTYSNPGNCLAAYRPTGVYMAPVDASGGFYFKAIWNAALLPKNVIITFKSTGGASNYQALMTQFLFYVQGTEDGDITKISPSTLIPYRNWMCVSHTGDASGDGETTFELTTISNNVLFFYVRSQVDDIDLSDLVIDISECR